MAKSGSTSLVPELKFLTFTQVCLPLSCFSAGKKKQNTKHKWIKSCSVPAQLPSETRLSEGRPPSLCPVASPGQVTNAQGQSPQTERAAVHSHFSLLSKCQRLLSEGKCQNHCQKGNIPFLFSGQTQKRSYRVENGGPW